MTVTTTTISLEAAAQILAIGGGPRYGNIFTLRRNAQMGRLTAWLDESSGSLVTTEDSLERFRDQWLTPEADSLSNIAEIERKTHEPTPEVEAFMARHGDARHGAAVAAERLRERQKRPTSKLRKLTPKQFEKAWREGGHGPLPSLD